MSAAKQRLEATLWSENTGVRFRDDTMELRYRTRAGDNEVYIWNNGRARTQYRLTVTVH